MIRVDREAKKRYILAAASRVFARKGFFNTRISDIARECSMADGTLYIYFKSKDDILISIFEEKMEYFLQRFREKLSSSPDSAQDQLKDFVTEYFALAKEFPDFAEVITVELRQSSKFIKEYSNEKFFEFLKIIQSIIERGIRKGEIDKGINPQIAARSIFGIMDEMILMWSLAKNKYNIENICQQVWKILSKGIFIDVKNT